MELVSVVISSGGLNSASNTNIQTVCLPCSGCAPCQVVIALRRVMLAPRRRPSYPSPSSVLPLTFISSISPDAVLSLSQAVFQLCHPEILGQGREWPGVKFDGGEFQ